METPANIIEVISDSNNAPSSGDSAPANIPLDTIEESSTASTASTAPAEVKRVVKVTRIILDNDGEEVKAPSTPFADAIDANPAKSQVFGAAPSDVPIETTDSKSTPVKFNHEDGARLLFNVVTNLGCGMLGPEWAPKSKEEAEGVIEPMAAYFKSKGVDDMPVGYVLLAAILIYSSNNRLTHPNTKTKLSFAWFRFKGFTKGLLSRFRKKEKNFAPLRSVEPLTAPHNGERH